MEHDGRMSLKVKKQLNYARQDWKEHWESLLAPCVRAALHEKRKSMVAGRRCYISITKGARLAFCALKNCNSTCLTINVLGLMSTRHSL
jgi:hypothetical protein